MPDLQQAQATEIVAMTEEAAAAVVLKQDIVVLAEEAAAALVLKQDLPVNNMYKSVCLNSERFLTEFLLITWYGEVCTYLGFHVLSWQQASQNTVLI